MSAPARPAEPRRHRPSADLPMMPDTGKLLQYLPMILSFIQHAPCVLFGFVVTLFYFLVIVGPSNFTSSVAPVAGFHILFLMVYREVHSPLLGVVAAFRKAKAEKNAHGFFIGTTGELLQPNPVAGRTVRNIAAHASGPTHPPSALPGERGATTASVPPSEEAVALSTAEEEHEHHANHRAGVREAFGPAAAGGEEKKRPSLPLPPREGMQLLTLFRLFLQLHHPQQQSSENPWREEEEEEAEELQYGDVMRDNDSAPNTAAPLAVTEPYPAFLDPSDTDFTASALRLANDSTQTVGNAEAGYLPGAPRLYGYPMTPQSPPSPYGNTSTLSYGGGEPTVSPSSPAADFSHGGLGNKSTASGGNPNHNHRTNHPAAVASTPATRNRNRSGNGADELPLRVALTSSGTHNNSGTSSSSPPASEGSSFPTGWDTAELTVETTQRQLRCSVVPLPFPFPSSLLSSGTAVSGEASLRLHAPLVFCCSATGVGSSPAGEDSGDHLAAAELVHHHHHHHTTTGSEAHKTHQLESGAGNAAMLGGSESGAVN